MMVPPQVQPGVEQASMDEKMERAREARYEATRANVRVRRVAAKPTFGRQIEELWRSYLSSVHRYTRIGALRAWMPMTIADALRSRMLVRASR
jgi:hypothetical protein